MLIGKALGGAFKHGFKALGAGLKTGSLSNPNTMKGIAFISVGMLGTTAMLRSITGTRERMRGRRAMDKYKQF